MFWLASISLWDGRAITTTARGYGSPPSRGRRGDWGDAVLKLRRRLFARLVDRDVLAVCDRGAAIGDDQRVEFDEAVAFLLVIACHLCPRGQFVAAARRRQQPHLAADMNPRPQDGVVDQHLVHDARE